MPPKDKMSPVKPKDTDDEKASHATLIVKDDDHEYRLRTDEFGPADSMACRQQTGLPVEHYFENMGLDSMLVVIWLARRKTGEPNLLFQKVMSKYSTNASLEKLTFEMKYDDDEKSDPKADSADGD